MKRLALVLLAGLFCVPGLAVTLLVGPKGVPFKLSEAIAMAKDGDVIDVLPGEYRGDVAVIPPMKLTIRGVGQRPVFHAEGKVADGKAIIVMRGGELTVENIEFRGARGPDANGAGIRFEAGQLKVLRCGFFDNENGIVTGNEDSARLEIEDSIFGDAPRVTGQLHHLLYVGRIGRVSVTGSRFHNGFEAHLIKSSARETFLGYNLLYDGQTGEASYEVDLPVGGQAWLIGNIIEQAAGSQHPVVVSFGAEGKQWPQNTLYMSHNTLINHKLLPAWFVRFFDDRLPAGAALHAVNNLFVGGGVFEWGASGHFGGNYPALTGMLLAPETWSFELPASSWLRGRGVDPRNFGGQDLSPKAEFMLPVGKRPLPAPTSWSPGAYQR